MALRYISAPRTASYILGAAALVIALLVGATPARAGAADRVRGLMEELRGANEGREISEETVRELVAAGNAVVPALREYLEDPNRRVRLASVSALLSLRGAAAVEDVAPLLRHPDEQTASATAGMLGDLRAAAALDPLKGLVVDEATPTRVRLAALRAIGATGAPEARGVLEERLVRGVPVPELTAVVDGLGAIGDPASLPALSKYLEDGERGAVVLRALGKWGAAGLEVLTARVRARPRDRELRRAAAEAAVALGEPGVPAVRELLDGADGAARVDVIEALKGLRDRAAADELLRPLVAERDDTILRAALEQIAADGDAESRGALEGLLEHRDAEIRELAAEGLGRIGAAESGFPLMAALRKAVAARGADSLSFRTKLLEALGHVGTRDVVPTLVEALGRPPERAAAMDALVAAGRAAVPSLLFILKAGDPQREALAVEALMRIGEGAGEEVVELVRHPDPRVRSIGLELTAIIGDKSAVPALQKMVRDPTAPDRLTALRVLALLYTPELRPFFQQIVENDETADIRRMALEALWRHGDLGASPILVNVLEHDPDVSVRRQAVAGLYFLGPPGATGTFRKVLEYEEPEVRIAAVEALSRSGDPRAFTPLLEAAEEAQGDLADAIATGITWLGRYQGTGDDRDWAAWFRSVRPAIEAAITGGTAETPLFAEADDGQKLAYAVDGDGPVVIGIHDGPDGDRKLLAQGLRALDDDFTVVTYDQRGRGESPRGETTWEGYSLVREARDLDAVRAAVGAERVALVGHGFGALIAIRYAASYPERVSRMVLMAPPYPMTDTFTTYSDDIRVRLQGAALTALRWLEARIAYSPPEVFATRWAYYAFPSFFARPDDAFAHAPPPLDPALRGRLMELLGDFNLEDALVQGGQPTLVMRFGRTVYRPDAQARWDRLVTLLGDRVEMRALRARGHFGFLEDNDGVVDQLVRDFLDREEDE